jgi:hypothetical protein
MAAVRQRQEVERDLLGEEPGEEPAAEVLVGGRSADAATPIQTKKRSEAAQMRIQSNWNLR